MSLSKVNTQLKATGQYLFNNPATDFTTVRADVFNGVLDAEGRAGVNIQLPVATGAPACSMQRSPPVFWNREEMRAFTRGPLFPSPFTSYVGINLNQPKGKYIETDKDHVLTS